MKKQFDFDSHYTYIFIMFIHCFRGHQNSAILQVKASLNAGMVKLVNLCAGMDLARGERCEGVQKGCIKKQNTRLDFYVINMIVGGDLKCAANNETIFG